MPFPRIIVNSLRACSSPSFDRPIGGNACARFCRCIGRTPRPLMCRSTPLSELCCETRAWGDATLASVCLCVSFRSIEASCYVHSATIACRFSLLSVHFSSTAQFHTPKPYNSRFGLALDSDHSHNHGFNNAHNSHQRLHANGPHLTGSRRRRRASGRGSDRGTSSSHS
jgi:hypothetical protein